MPHTSRKLITCIVGGALLLSMGCGGKGGSTTAAATRGLGIVGAGPQKSTNWCGYQLRGAPAGFNRVNGSWTVPAVQPSGGNTASSSWAGIGGGCINADCTLVDPTLIQAGTEQDSTSGQTSYSAWWEAIPAPSVQATGGLLDGGQFDVRPGDQINVVIDGTDLALWRITIADIRNGAGAWTFDTTVPYAAAGSTAEWIVEAPLVFGTGGAGQLALSNFGRVPFFALGANGANPGLTPDQQVVLVDGAGNVLANPSDPDASRDGFAVCYGPATCR